MSNEREELARDLSAAYNDITGEVTESDLRAASDLIGSGWRKAPGIVSTEWAVSSPWGKVAEGTRDKAETVVSNMRAAGVEAHLIWRGVTEWQEL